MCNGNSIFSKKRTHENCTRVVLSFNEYGAASQGLASGCSLGKKLSLYVAMANSCLLRYVNLKAHDYGKTCKV